MIYLLHKNPSKNAQMLADNDLCKMIWALAQALCNVHWLQLDRDIAKGIEINHINIPLDEKDRDSLFTQYADECLANYNYLVDIGQQCCIELNYRFEGLTQDQIKLEKVLLWAQDNPINLSEEEKSHLKYFIGDKNIIKFQPTPFPLVMNKKHIEILSTTVREGQPCPVDIVQSYRNAYRAKIKNKLDKCNSIFESPNELAGGCIENNNLVEIKWSRRTKPEWLEI